MRYWIAITALFLAACGDQYRYPCQDPANWDKDFCRKPICDINRTCPEHIFKGSDPSKMVEAGQPIPDALKALNGSTAAKPPVLPPLSRVPQGVCK